MRDLTMPLSLHMLSPDVLFSAFSEDEKSVDFSGIWALDFKGSEIEHTPIQPEPVLVIDHVARSTEPKSFDTTMELDAGNGEKMYCMMTQEWMAEQHTMKMVTKFTEDEKGDVEAGITGTETWVLSDHGQTLTITNKMELTDTAEQIKLVYKKQ